MSPLRASQLDAKYTLDEREVKVWKDAKLTGIDHLQSKDIFKQSWMIYVYLAYISYT